MCSTKLILTFAFLLTSAIVINGSPLCPKVCLFEANPLCITFKDGTTREFTNICTLSIETCNRNIEVLEIADIEEGACPADDEES